MAQDFANGQRHKRAPRSDARNRPRQRQSAFHWGSFGAGIALGIAFTLAGALLPEWWGNRPAAVAAAPVASDVGAGDSIRVLRATAERKDLVAPGTGRYLDGSAGRRWYARVSVAGRLVHEQGRRRTVARDARTIGLEHARRRPSRLSSGATRHRVIVGPFASSQETQRAITQLRKQDVDALVLARKPTAG